MDGPSGGVNVAWRRHSDGRQRAAGLIYCRRRNAQQIDQLLTQAVAVGRLLGAVVERIPPLPLLDPFSVTALGAVQYRSPTLEADEAIAALVHRFDDEPVVLRSDDKDFMQLLSGRVRMEGRVRKTVRYSDVKGILGVTPAFAADWQALTGDTADGIPRIVPPKKAERLIERRGHVRDWLDGELPEGEPLRKTLDARREQIRLNLELVDLSAAAVAARGAPGEPLLDGWGDLDVARGIGRETGISWLADDDLAESWAALREGGEATRRRLEI